MDVIFDGDTIQDDIQELTLIMVSSLERFLDKHNYIKNVNIKFDEGHPPIKVKITVTI